TLISEWEKNGENIRMKIKIPVGTEATVNVPAESPNDVKEGGEPATERSGISFLKMEKGFALFHIESGEYYFSGNINLQQ
ncbi:MAG: alpha-L-rhamnosidase C-terminal domain-containing protein, partial [Prolixibacteraceae bacterium]